jgi:hypothetical protein
MVRRHEEARWSTGQAILRVRRAADNRTLRRRQACVAASRVDIESRRATRTGGVGRAQHPTDTAGAPARPGAASAHARAHALVRVDASAAHRAAHQAGPRTRRDVGPSDPRCCSSEPSGRNRSRRRRGGASGAEPRGVCGCRSGDRRQARGRRCKHDSALGEVRQPRQGCAPSSRVGRKCWAHPVGSSDGAVGQMKERR